MGCSMHKAFKIFGVLTLATAAPAQAAWVSAETQIYSDGLGPGTPASKVWSNTDTPPFQPSISTTSSAGGGTSWAMADLASGTLRGTAHSPGYNPKAVFSVGFFDAFTFNVAGATADTVTRLFLDVYFDAKIQGGGYAKLETAIASSFSRIWLTPADFTAYGYDAVRPGYNDGIAFSDVGSGFVRGTYSQRIPFDVTGQTSLVGFQASAFGGAGGGALDFGNSAHFGFRLPEGVTVTSQSGTAFTTLAPGVPEPATWAMMITGFGCIGWGLRRRRSTVSRPALVGVLA